MPFLEQRHPVRRSVVHRLQETLAAVHVGFARFPDKYIRSDQIRVRLQQRLDLQRLTFGRLAAQAERSLLALTGAHPAAHAQHFVDPGDEVLEGQRAELAVVQAVAAAQAKIFINLVDVTGGGQHRHAAAHRLHRTAAAGAAVADGVEAVEHGVLEKGVVNVTACVLRLQDFRRLSLADPACRLRVVLADHAGKRLTHDQAYVQGQAGVGAG